MCLGIPGKITEIKDNLMASVEMGDIERDVSLQLLPEAEVGDYVLIHTGFAIQRLDEDEANETLRLLKEMAGIDDEVSK